MLKPEAIKMRIIGEIIRRIESKGLRVVALKLIKASKKHVEKLYEMHKDKPFYEKLVNWVASGPIVVMVVEGNSAINVMRELAGATNPAEAAPGTIRKDYGLNITQNVIHAADGPENALREIRIFFRRNNIFEY
jgi:nucleoside-diphosphate kinase